VKKTCYWCDVKKRECRVLEEPVCSVRRCSFFETARCYVERQRKFRKKKCES